jgi:HEAT repeat protein
MGETGLKAAADTLIKILSQAHTPEMKIECLIGLGKLKETRAASLMQELSNDTNDAVS